MSMTTCLHPSLRLGLFGALGLLLGACPADDTDTATGTTNADTSGTAGSSSGGTETSTTESTGPGSSSGADTSGSESGSGSTTADPDTSSSGGTTGAVDVCEPAVEDTECETCMKTNCCESLDACASDADCSCTFACVVETGGNPSEAVAPCAKECGTTYDAVIGQFAAIGICQMGNCNTECAPPA